MKSLLPSLVALLVAGSALAQEAEPPQPAGEAGAASEGTDTEEPEETGTAEPEAVEPQAVEPEPAEPEADETDAPVAAPAPPPTSYNPSRTYVPSGPALSAQSGATPPTSFNPSGAYIPSSPTLDPQTRLPPTSFNPSGAYAPPSYYARPVWPQSGAPVFIDEAGKTPDAPPSYADAAYESRLRASFLAAQGMKGPLEGGWVIAAPDGKQLFHLQLVDASGGYIEGAWRDLRRPGAIDSSGLIVGSQRIGNQASVRFYPPGARDAVNITLNATYDGRWSGELIQGAERRPVTLQRN